MKCSYCQSGKSDCKFCQSYLKSPCLTKKEKIAIYEKREGHKLTATEEKLFENFLKG